MLILNASVKKGELTNYFCLFLHACICMYVCSMLCVWGGGGGGGVLGILMIHVNEVIIEVYNILKGLCRRYISSSCGGQFCMQFKPV